MPRRRATPTTALAAAIQAKRGNAKLRDIADEAGLSWATLARLERGGGVQKIATRMAVARWLGWSEERVIEACRPNQEEP
jgi:hypothetical protein